MVEFTYTSDVWGAIFLSGDINNDGFWDVLALRSDWDFWGLRLFWGKPDGTLDDGGIVPLRISLFADRFGIRLVDFDGDGNLDLLGSGLNVGNGFIARGDGTGRFEVTTEGIWHAGKPRIVDLDDDGWLDLVTAGVAPFGILEPRPFSILIYRGTGSGTVAPVMVLPIRRFDPNQNAVYDGLATGDFDGDGILDIVACGRFSPQLAVFRGRGDGTYEEEFYFDPPVADIPTAVLLHDFDLDGREDLVIGYRLERGEIYWGKKEGGFDFSNPHRIQSWLVSWLDVQTGIDWEFIRGDADRDGSVDLSDAIAILEQLFRGRRVDCGDASDADDSGRVEITDAVYLLEYLFLSGDSPPYPFPDAGGDFTDDATNDYSAGINGQPGTAGDLGCSFETWYYRGWTTCPPDAPDCDWPPPQEINLGGRFLGN
jgi:hypothetical protein